MIDNIKSKSLIQVHIAVLLFGLAGLFGKFLTLPAMVIVEGRVFFAAIFLSILLRFNKISLRLTNKKDYMYLGILGVLLAVHWVTFFKSIQLSTVTVGLLTFSTFPVFTTFLEPMAFKTKVRGLDVLLALITLLGVWFVVPELRLESSITQGAILGIVSGFTFSVLSILNKKYVNTYSSLVIAFYQDLTAGIVLMPFIFVIKPVFSTNNILLLLLLGVVFTGISHSLFIKGLKNVNAQRASIIASLEPVYGIIFAAIFIGEVPSLKEIVGGVIILGTAFYSTVMSK